MGKIICILGPSSSGKDTVYQRLLKQELYFLEPLVSYTTRPIRAGERDGQEYFFTDEEGYRKLEEEGKVLEERTYHTIQGDWRYFTVFSAQMLKEEKNYIMIGTLDSFCKIKEKLGEDRICPIYIEIEDGERLQRALTRERKQKNPQYEEMCRRYLADKKDFSEERIRQAGIRKKFSNNCLEECIAEISQYISEVL